MHILATLGNDFVDDTIYISPGDTLELDSPYHSATEIDSIDWVNNVANYNGGFDVGQGSASPGYWFVISDPGTYYYICRPHAAMGMKGIIIAQAGLGVEPPLNQDDYQVFQGADHIQLQYMDADLVEVYDVQGAKVGKSILEANSTRATISLDLSPGTYIFRFSKGDELRASKKALLLR